MYAVATKGTVAIFRTIDVYPGELAKRVCETVETLYVTLEHCICVRYITCYVALILRTRRYSSDIHPLFETNLSSHSDYLNRYIFS